MSTTPFARLQDISGQEKIKLSSVLKRKLLLRGILFFLAISLSLAVIIFFNKYSESYQAENNLELINVAFVIILVLCARLLFSEWMEYRAEISSPRKKIIQTKILGRQDGKIVLGNKSFGKEEIILDNSDFDSLQEGDEVLIELSTKSNTIFSVKRI